MFSPNETKLLEVLGDREMTISEITKRMFPKPNLNSSIVVATAVNRIIRKCEYHRMTWTLKSKGHGRAGKTVWRGKR